MGGPIPAGTPYTAARMSPLRLPRPRDRQRGNSLLLALIVLSALATLGSLTVVSVQSSLKTSTNDRAQAIAMYAAESGGAIVMDFLRNNFNLATGWSAYVTPSNTPPFVPTTAQIPSVTVRPPPGPPPPPSANPFSLDQNAWYEAMLLNNRDDPGFADPSDNDKDGRIIIRITGHGPQGSLAIIEWDVLRVGLPPPTTPPTPPPPPWTLPLPPGMVLMSWHVVSL
jgi:hypothetical protein